MHGEVFDNLLTESKNVLKSLSAGKPREKRAPSTMITIDNNQLEEC